jgi:hypothetical protein
VLFDKELRKILLCVGMMISASGGAAMRPEEMEDLLHARQTETVQLSTNKDANGWAGVDLVADEFAIWGEGRS